MSLSEAIEVYKEGNYGRARDLCLKALEGHLSPDDRFMAQTYLGHCLAQLGDRVQAVEEFRRALPLTHDPTEQVQLHYALGLELHKMGNNLAARRELERAVELYEVSPAAEVRDHFVYSLIELATLAGEAGDYSDVLAYLDRASVDQIRSQPGNQQVLFHMDLLRGKALVGLKRWRESIPVLRSAVTEVPEGQTDARSVATGYLGLALCAVREYEEAFGVMQAADLGMHVNPGLWAATRVWLGNLYYGRSEFAKALEQYERVIDQPAENWAGSRESLARMADCYLETGQPESALAVAEKAYRELRGNDLVHVEYAKALAVARRWREADQVLRELNEEAVDEGLKERFYTHSAYVAAGLQDRNGAEQWLRKLRDLNPSSRYLPPLEKAIGEKSKRPKGFLRWFRGQH